MVAADRRRRPRSSSAARTAPSTRSTRRPAASTGPSRRRAACAPRSSFGSRSGGGGYAVYFGDTGANVYALDAATGRELWSRRLDEHLYARDHRIADAVSGSALRAGLLDGRDRREPAGLRVLHVSRQRERARRGERRHGVAHDAWCRTAQPAGKNAAGVALWGPSGVGVWSAPTIDVKRRLRLRRHRQHLQRRRAADRRRHRRLRSDERRDRLDPSADRGRRVRLPRRQRELRREGRTRLRPRHAADADHARRRPRRHRRGAEIGERVRDRSGPAGRAALAVSRRRRIDLGRHSVGRRGRRRSRLLPGVRHPHAETRRLACRQPDHRRARLVRRRRCR